MGGSEGGDRVDEMWREVIEGGETLEGVVGGEEDETRGAVEVEGVRGG